MNKFNLQFFYASNEIYEIFEENIIRNFYYYENYKKIDKKILKNIVDKRNEEWSGRFSRRCDIPA